MRKLLFPLLLTVTLTGCLKPTYQRCKDLYGTALQDSVTLTKTVTVTVPKDSAVLVVDRQTLLDTIPFMYYVQSPNGARVMLKTVRLPGKVRQIEARADCPEKVITRTVTVKAPPTQNKFGVNPFWKTVAIVEFFLILGAVGYHLVRTGKIQPLLVAVWTWARRLVGFPV